LLFEHAIIKFNGGEMRTKTIEILFLVLGFSLLIVCKQNGVEWKGTITEEDGVIVVKNPMELMYGEEAFNLEEELTLGEAEGREEYLFSRILIDVDENENIYVLDNQTATIRVFNKQGEYLKTIGKKGQGPGELISPRTIQITPQNEIMVYDFGIRRLTFFSLEGEFLRHVSAAKALVLGDTKMDSQGNIISIYVDRENISLIKYDSNLEPSLTISSESLDWNRDPSIYEVMRPMPYFSVTREDEIIYGYSDKYEILVYDSGGELIRKILKEYDPKPVTEKDKEDHINYISGGRGLPKELKVVFPKHLLPFMSISLDDQGRIFVGTLERPEGLKHLCFFDIFDLDGKYIAKVPIRIQDYHYPLFWKKGKLYVIDEDEAGYEVVKRYNVNWNIDQNIFRGSILNLFSPVKNIKIDNICRF
jgi:hypothetical protein